MGGKQRGQAGLGRLLPHFSLRSAGPSSAVPASLGLWSRGCRWASPWAFSPGHALVYCFSVKHQINVPWQRPQGWNLSPYIFVGLGGGILRAPPFEILPPLPTSLDLRTSVLLPRHGRLLGWPFLWWGWLRPPTEYGLIVSTLSCPPLPVFLGPFPPSDLSFFLDSRQGPGPLFACRPRGGAVPPQFLHPFPVSVEREWICF